MKVVIPPRLKAAPKKLTGAMTTAQQLHQCMSNAARQGIILNPKKTPAQKAAAARSKAQKAAAAHGKVAKAAPAAKKVAAKKVPPKKVTAKQAAARTAMRNKALAKQLANCKKKCPKC